MDKITISHLAYTLLKNQTAPDDKTVLASSEDIRIRLKFLSHVKKDQKIDTKNLKLYQNGYLAAIYRTIYPENRIDAIRFIKEIVNRSFEMIDYYDATKKNLELMMLVHDLVKSVEGLVNLRSTYEKDTAFVCSMDLVIESIKIKLKKLDIDIEDEECVVFDPFLDNIPEESFGDAQSDRQSDQQKSKDTVKCSIEKDDKNKSNPI